MFSNKDKPSCSYNGMVCMWAVFTAIFLATTLTLTAAILFLVINNPDLKWNLSDDSLISTGGGGATSSSGGGWKHHTSKDSNVFAELTQNEINNTLKFLLNDEELKLTRSENAKISDNYVFMMEVKQPNKADMLEYLNEGVDKPTREATVVLIMGNRTTQAHILEIVVSPLPDPTRWRQVNSYKWKLRPRMSPPEVKAMEMFLKSQTIPIKNSMKRVFGFGFSDCEPDFSCLEWIFTTPPVPSGDRRNTWITFRKPHPGSALHALPLYLLVDDQDRNPESWEILKYVYKNSIYSSMELLKNRSDNEAIMANVSEVDKTRTSLQKRNTESFYSGPETRGKGRYHLDGERVQYFHWSFDFRHRISSGLQLFDIRFNQKRIVYELSIQGIMSFYSGSNPFMMHARYLENQEPLGYTTSELKPGLDCPNNADFFDGYYYDPFTGKPKLRSSYVCIFEHDTNVPLKRHRSKGKFGGIPGKSLVVRTIQTFRETDFIFDFLFYNNGALETRFYTSGYPLGTFWSKEDANNNMFGYPISENQLSPVSSHFVNYKVSFIVNGFRNSFHKRFQCLPM